MILADFWLPACAYGDYSAIFSSDRGGSLPALLVSMCALHPMPLVRSWWRARRRGFIVSRAYYLTPDGTGARYVPVWDSSGPTVQDVISTVERILGRPSTCEGRSRSVGDATLTGTGNLEWSTKLSLENSVQPWTGQ